MDFEQFLSPKDSLARYNQDLADKVLFEGEDLSTKFDYFWAILKPSSEIHDLNGDKPPEAILTTADILTKRRSHFADTRVIPAYPKER